MTQHWPDSDSSGNQRRVVGRENCLFSALLVVWVLQKINSILLFFFLFCVLSAGVREVCHHIWHNKFLMDTHISPQHLGSRGRRSSVSLRPVPGLHSELQISHVHSATLTQYIDINNNNNPPSMVWGLTCPPSTWEAKTGELPLVREQPGIHLYVTPVFQRQAG